MYVLGQAALCCPSVKQISNVLDFVQFGRPHDARGGSASPRPVKVVFMAYRNSLQADALKLVAQKMQSSLAVEGELPEDGLAGYGGTGDDLMMALARKLVSGDSEDEPVEDIFRQAQEIAAQADQLLVDAEWERSEPEPPLVIDTEVVEMSPIALMPCEHHTGHAERQSRFSWAEFLSKEPKPTRRRGRKPVQPSASLFDWALEREQQAGLAAAGG